VLTLPIDANDRVDAPPQPGPLLNDDVRAWLDGE
jgi:hypothetical protein